jgi:hypothetical protein
MLIVQRRRPAPAYDADAQAYITAVEAADGQALESGVRDAVNTLVLALKAASIWSVAAQILLPCGPRTLAGALLPLRGAAPTNNGFIGDNYNRELGLGDPANTSKWLNSNVLQNALGATSHALAWYGSISEATGDRTLIGHYDGATSATLIALDAYAAYVTGRCFRSALVNGGTFPVTTGPVVATACMVGSRTASNAAALYVDGAAITRTNLGTLNPQSRIIGWFAMRSGTTAVAFSRSLLQVGGIFSAGLNATQAAEFRSASAAYVAAVAAAIP